jgi:transcriptional regulator NrdR family protein
VVENILKRNGIYKKFTPYKIKDAIKKAFESENITYDSVKRNRGCKNNCVNPKIQFIR